MAKGNILKEAIADAKAVREVALANAKAALEEAFTPKLQSMLSAKLSEDLDEDMYYDEDEKDPKLPIEKGLDDKDMLERGDDMMYDEDEMMYDEDEMMYDEDETSLDIQDKEEDSMDEEIDLEEILNELESEEGDEAEEDEDIEEAVGYPNYRADQVQKVKHDANDINQGLNESEEFDLNSLLKEINDLEDEEEILEIEDDEEEKDKVEESKVCRCNEEKITIHNLRSQIKESKKAYMTARKELNEVNLLNSKLLYVNRIFKVNDLSETQKLSVVETLDKASSTKEAKLIYETIKDTFTISNKNRKFKSTPKRPIRENFKGMASKTIKSSAPRKPILKESNNMVARMQKLANINKINE